MPRDKHGKAIPPEKREGTPAIPAPEQPSKTPEDAVPAKKTGSDANYGRKRH